MKSPRYYAAELRFVRAEEPVRGTHWHPLSHVEYTPRARRQGRLSLEQLRDYMSGGLGTQSRPIRIQNPYNSSYDMNDGFSIDPATLAITSEKLGIVTPSARRQRRKIPEPSHIRQSAAERKARAEERAREKVGHVALSTYKALAPLSVAHRGVRIGQNTRVGSKAELLPWSTIGEGVTIESEAVVSKRAKVADGARIAAHAFVGIGVDIGIGTSIDMGTVIHKYGDVGQGTEIESWVSSGKRTFIGNGVYIGEGARLGEYVRVYNGATIGEDAVISDFSVINADSIVGVGAQIGKTGHVMGWVRAGEVVSGHGVTEATRRGMQQDAWEALIAQLPGMHYPESDEIVIFPITDLD